MYVEKTTRLMRRYQGIYTTCGVGPINFRILLFDAVVVVVVVVAAAAAAWGWSGPVHHD
jgi:hypothetical protein